MAKKNSLKTLQNLAPDVFLATKDDIINLAQLIANKVNDEGFDGLNLLSYAVKNELFWGQIVTAAKPLIVEEIRKFGKGGTERLGVGLVVAEVGTSYSFTDDPTWQRLNLQVTLAKATLKDWEDKLRKLPYGGATVNVSETGETYHAYPPVKTATDSVKCTINNAKK